MNILSHFCNKVRIAECYVSIKCFEKTWASKERHPSSPKSEEVMKSCESKPYIFNQSFNMHSICVLVNNLKI